MTSDIDALVKLLLDREELASRGGVVFRQPVAICVDAAAAIRALQARVAELDMALTTSRQDAAGWKHSAQQMEARAEAAEASIGDILARNNQLMQDFSQLFIRAEAAEAALTRAWEAGRDDAAKRVWSAHDNKDADYWGASPGDIARRERAAAVLAMTPPADLAAKLGVAE